MRRETVCRSIYSLMKDDKEWYRARFAGFSKVDAQAACAVLKKMSLDCVVMSAE